MKRLLVAILKAFLNARYRRWCRLPRGNTALFISRQSNEPSADFRRIGACIRRHEGWQVVYSVKMLDGGLGDKLAYARHMLEEVRLLAQCRVCFVEGYNPVLSLLDLKAEELGGGTRNHEAPLEPVVLQVWHAGGMYKKFGFQCMGTQQGRSEQDAALFKMHRNYSWIVCSGSAARPVYAEAFGYPVERTVALGRAVYDRFFENDPNVAKRALAAYPQLKGEHRPVIVFAPTLRRGTTHVETFEELQRAIEGTAWAEGYELIWSGHPVMTPSERRVASTTDLLRYASLLVTDYSATVYDAVLLKVPAAFYVPDIESYAQTPGLNTSPLQTSPGLCAQTPEELMALIDRCLAPGGAYPQAELDAFAAEALDACTPGSAQRIAAFALEQVETSAAGKEGLQ